MATWIEIQPAIDRVKKGQPILLPTDTVWGLGAAPWAATQLNRMKKRRGPLAILGAGERDFEDLGWRSSNAIRKALRSLWPGPFTAVIPACPELCSLVASKTSMSGFRIPASDHLRAFLRRTGPLVVTSANLHGEKPSKESKGLPFHEIPRVRIQISNVSGRPSTVGRWTGSGWEILRDGVG